MQSLIDIFNNSIMQSMFIGPLMGVIFASIFAGLTNKPSESVPKTIIQTKEIYIHKTIEYREYKKNTDEGGGILILIGFGLLFILWKYSIYVDIIHYYIELGLITILTFSISTMIISYIKGQFTSREWWIYIISPLLFLIISLILQKFAYSNFDTQLTSIALKNNVIQFYTQALSDYGRNIILTHVFGIIFLCLVSLLSFLAMIHYLSLMNQRSNGFMSNFWFFITKKTMFFSGKKWLFLSMILLILTYLCIEPTAIATWITNEH